MQAIEWWPEVRPEVILFENPAGGYIVKHTVGGELRTICTTNNFNDAHMSLWRCVAEVDRLREKRRKGRAANG